MRRFSAQIPLISAALAMAILAGELTPLPVLADSLGEQITEKIIALKESEQKWIEINLASQRLIAWQGRKPVYAVIVSTGKPATPTPQGIFAIKIKRPKDRMRGADYDLPDVPHVMYYQGGYAIHGTYWHNRFGTPVSHGCTNVAVDHAQWLYQWASVGTPVVIHE